VAKAWRLATVVRIVLVQAAALWIVATVEASPQEPTGVPLVSLANVRAELERTPAPWLGGVRWQQPAATFRTGVDQRVWVLTLQEELHKEFDLTPLRRSQLAWAAKCCGIDIGMLIKPIDNALKARQLRKIREQIAQELADLEAARKQ